MRISRRRPIAAIAGLTLGAMLAGAASISAAADPTAESASVTPRTVAAPAFPSFVHLPADQAAHPGVAQEWWYVVGHVNANDHRFGYEVQIVSVPEPEAVISITDKTTGAYSTWTQSYSPDEATFSRTELDARTPSATLSGPMDAMHLHASMPDGVIDLTLNARGPALHNNGTGLMPFLGGTSYYYSLPSVESHGTITEKGHTYRVGGESWVDRQWGTWDWTSVQRWTWMPLQLSNGDRVNLWDLFDRSGEAHYATVLHPDGNQEIVAVDPLADRTSAFWTSPATGKRYGTRWTVRIPAMDASLVVVADVQGQETPAYGGIWEGAAGVTGRYAGKPITGKAYVEQLGNWQG